MLNFAVFAALIFAGFRGSVSATGSRTGAPCEWREGHEEVVGTHFTGQYSNTRRILEKMPASDRVPSEENWLL
jgi:hypothetical protein